MTSARSRGIGGAIALWVGCASEPVAEAPVAVAAPPEVAAPGVEVPPAPAVVAAVVAVAPDVPDDDTALLAAWATSEAACRDPSTTGDALASHGHRVQRIFRVLADDVERAARVRALVPVADLPTFDGHLEGTRRSAATVTRRRVDLPPWDIVPALDPSVLHDAWTSASAEFGVPWTVLAGVHLVETRMGRIRGTSHAGAQGPMQFMPGTWAIYGEGDVNDPHDAIRAAGRYLSAMGAARDLDKALWHYNQSDDYGRAVRAFAAVMDAHPNAWRAYWGWQVYYRTTSGDVWLREGYHATDRRDVPGWCAEVAATTALSAPYGVPTRAGCP